MLKGETAPALCFSETRAATLVGLTRGFMYAAARRVMASLWTVDDDATADLMSRFYEKMLAGQRLRPAAALREAQVEAWKRDRWRAPYYWAPSRSRASGAEWTLPAALQ